MKDALEQYAVLKRWTVRDAFTGKGPETAFVRQMLDYRASETWSGREDDHSFRVAVPVSGGMDSTTAWEMAMECGLEAVPIFLLSPAPWNDLELDCCRAYYGDQLVVLDPELPNVVDEVMLPGRNAIFLWAAAAYLSTNGWWGEVWFGNNLGSTRTGWTSETPVVGGDKSHRFLLTLNQLLTLEGFDVRVHSPLMSLTKLDMVHWWHEHRHAPDFLFRTFSCHAPVDAEWQKAACGRCRACFRKMVAFKAFGLDPDPIFQHGTDWTARVLEYEEEFGAAEGDHSDVAQFIARWAAK